MDKKEKYYNYVVEDLVKNTEIYHDQETIKFPFYYTFLSLSIPTYLPLSLLLSSPPSHYYSLFSHFSNYVIERYGVHDEEMEIIWNLYKEKIQPLIKK